MVNHNRYLIAFSVLLTVFALSGCRISGTTGTIHSDDPGTSEITPTPAPATNPGGGTPTPTPTTNPGGTTPTPTPTPTSGVQAPLNMSLIPAGSFTMGDTMDGHLDAVPHNVFVSAFYIDKYLVTYALWSQVYGWATQNSYFFTHSGAGKAANHPAQYITWYDAVKWCNLRSETEGLTPVYYTDASHTTVYRSGTIDLNNDSVNWSASGYRLPTEAEWEKAAWGGVTNQRFWWGNTIRWSNANYNSGNLAIKPTYDVNPTPGANPAFTGGSTYPYAANAIYPFTNAVDYFPPNGYGLYDMGGNLEQLVWDLYSLHYYAEGASDPRGPSSSTSLTRVIRGGSWGDGAGNARTAARDSGTPRNYNSLIGFRTVRGP